MQAHAAGINQDAKRPGAAIARLLAADEIEIHGGDLADLVQDPPGVAALPDGRALAPGQPALYTLTVMDGANATVARASLCRVAYDTRMAWTTIRLYHDATKQGLTRAAFQKLAEAAAHCNGKA